MDKFFNRAIVGNKKIVASYTEHGDLQRFCYPAIDGRQFVDFFHVGLKINDSNILYLHDDINNTYNQKYIKDTNVLVTEVRNSYFKLKIEQVDCALINKNVLVRKYTFKNDNDIDLDLTFLVNSKILANSLENFGSRIFDNGIVQYNHNYTFNIFSNVKVSGHRLNDVKEQLQSAILTDKDYIGMSNEVAISYSLGTLKPHKSAELYLYVWAGENTSDIESKVYNELKFDAEEEIEETVKYWQKYVTAHNSIRLKNMESKFNKKLVEIYNRTILLYPLLINYDVGGVAAALEVDDERNKSGGYRYCWTRDAIFITKAFDLLKMRAESELFYNKFCKQTQSKNGMWEQRFFTDGRLAPCWGYQIDETASVVYGVYEHYVRFKSKTFLESNLKMCENAVKFLCEYTENLLELNEDDVVKKELKEKNKKIFNPAKQVSYDLWEMHEGVHLYSLCAIISGFKAMEKIYKALNDEDEKNARLKNEKRNKTVQKLKKYEAMLKTYIDENLVDDKSNTLKRNTKDDIVDISVMGAVYPFNTFSADDKIVKNTVDRINMTLRTYKNSYLRFEGDSYMNGENPWVITTLWMAMYYIRIGDMLSAEKCFKFVVNSCAQHGFLSEQVSNDDENFQWVIGLGWSHAMFVIVLDELLKAYDKGKG